MGRLELYVLFIIFGCSVAIEMNRAYCFQFRWMGPLFSNNSSKAGNCTDLIGAPCVEPMWPLDTPPNTTKIWEGMQEKYMCDMTSGNVCIKYTYEYNNAIVNTSSYCGKVIADQTTAITEECFYQQVEGYSISVCACQSRRGGMPCNKSGRMESSAMLATMCLLLGLFIVTV